MERVIICVFFLELEKGPQRKRNSLFWRVWSFFWKDFSETRKKMFPSQGRPVIVSASPCCCPGSVAVAVALSPLSCSFEQQTSTHRVGAVDASRR